MNKLLMHLGEADIFAESRTGDKYYVTLRSRINPSMELNLKLSADDILELTDKLNNFVADAAAK
jgi:hypothetical protein